MLVFWKRNGLQSLGYKKRFVFSPHANIMCVFIFCPFCTFNVICPNLNVDGR